MAATEKPQNSDLKATESHGRGSVAEGDLEILGYKPELQVGRSEHRYMPKIETDCIE
jgi:hypothetical protein